MLFWFETVQFRLNFFFLTFQSKGLQRVNDDFVLADYFEFFNFFSQSVDLINNFGLILTMLVLFHLYISHLGYHILLLFFKFGSSRHVLKHLNELLWGEIGECLDLSLRYIEKWVWERKARTLKEVVQLTTRDPLSIQVILFNALLHIEWLLDANFTRPDWNCVFLIAQDNFYTDQFRIVFTITFLKTSDKLSYKCKSSLLFWCHWVESITEHKQQS